MDLHLRKGEDVFLPDAPSESAAFIFYAFNGAIRVNENMILTTGESVLIEKEHPVFHALENTDIILFITQTNADHFDGGMYSGNLHK